MIHKVYKMGTFTLAIQCCLLLVILTSLHVTHAQKRVATGSVPPPAFKDPERKQKLAAAFPEIGVRG